MSFVNYVHKTWNGVGCFNKDLDWLNFSVNKTEV